jgi:hypothetical protein
MILGYIWQCSLIKTSGATIPTLQTNGKQYPRIKQVAWQCTHAITCNTFSAGLPSHPHLPHTPTAHNTHTPHTPSSHPTHKCSTPAQTPSMHTHPNPKPHPPPPPPPPPPQNTHRHRHTPTQFGFDFEQHLAQLSDHPLHLLPGLIQVNGAQADSTIQVYGA